jgi:hypothetical protein
MTLSNARSALTAFRTEEKNKMRAIDPHPIFNKLE